MDNATIVWPSPIRVKEEPIATIDLDSFKTSEELVYEWDENVKKQFYKQILPENKPSLFDRMKWYLRQLKDEAANLQDLETLINVMVKHMKFLQFAFTRSKQMDYITYLDIMEDIILFYFNTNIKYLTNKRTTVKKSEMKKILATECRRIKCVLQQCLLDHHERILHVLMNCDVDVNSQSCKDLLNKVFAHFLTRVKQSTSDESFLRGYIIFRKWKLIRTPDVHDTMDICMYKLFKKSPEMLQTNDLFNKVIFGCGSNSMSFCLDVGDNIKNMVKLFDEHVKTSLVDEDDDVIFDLNVTRLNDGDSGDEMCDAEHIQIKRKAWEQELEDANKLPLTEFKTELNDSIECDDYDDDIIEIDFNPVKVTEWPKVKHKRKLTSFLENIPIPPALVTVENPVPDNINAQNNELNNTTTIPSIENGILSEKTSTCPSPRNEETSIVSSISKDNPNNELNANKIVIRHIADLPPRLTWPALKSRWSNPWISQVPPSTITKSLIEPSCKTVEQSVVSSNTETVKCDKQICAPTEIAMEEVGQTPNSESHHVFEADAVSEPCLGSKNHERRNGLILVQSPTHISSSKALDKLTSDSDCEKLNESKNVESNQEQLITNECDESDNLENFKLINDNNNTCDNVEDSINICYGDEKSASNTAEQIKNNGNWSSDLTLHNSKSNNCTTVPNAFDKFIEKKITEDEFCLKTPIHPYKAPSSDSFIGDTSSTRKTIDQSPENIVPDDTINTSTVIKINGDTTSENSTGETLNDLNTQIVTNGGNSPALSLEQLDYEDKSVSELIGLDIVKNSPYPEQEKLSRPFKTAAERKALPPLHNKVFEDLTFSDKMALTKENHVLAESDSIEASYNQLSAVVYKEDKYNEQHPKLLEESKKDVSPLEHENYEANAGKSLQKTFSTDTDAAEICLLSAIENDEKITEINKSFSDAFSSSQRDEQSNIEVATEYPTAEDSQSLKKGSEAKGSSKEVYGRTLTPSSDNSGRAEDYCVDPTNNTKSNIWPSIEYTPESQHDQHSDMEFGDGHFGESVNTDKTEEQPLTCYTDILSYRSSSPKLSKQMFSIAHLAVSSSADTSRRLQPTKESSNKRSKVLKSGKKRVKFEGGSDSDVDGSGFGDCYTGYDTFDDKPNSNQLSPEIVSPKFTYIGQESSDEDVDHRNIETPDDDSDCVGTTRQAGRLIDELKAETKNKYNNKRINIDNSGPPNKQRRIHKVTSNIISRNEDSYLPRNKIFKKPDGEYHSELIPPARRINSKNVTRNGANDDSKLCFIRYDKTSVGVTKHDVVKIRPSNGSKNLKAMSLNKWIELNRSSPGSKSIMDHSTISSASPRRSWGNNLYPDRTKQRNLAMASRKSAPKS